MHIRRSRVRSASLVTLLIVVTIAVAAFAAPAQAASRHPKAGWGRRTRPRARRSRSASSPTARARPPTTASRRRSPRPRSKWINQYRDGIGGHPIDLDICVDRRRPEQEHRLREPDDPGRRGGGGRRREPVHPERPGRRSTPPGIPLFIYGAVQPDRRRRHRTRRSSCTAGPSAFQNLIIGAAKKHKAKKVSAVAIDVPAGDAASSRTGRAVPEGRPEAGADSRSRGNGRHDAADAEGRVGQPEGRRVRASATTRSASPRSTGCAPRASRGRSPRSRSASPTRPAPRCRPTS